MKLNYGSNNNCLEWYWVEVWFGIAITNTETIGAMCGVELHSFLLLSYSRIHVIALFISRVLWNCWLFVHIFFRRSFAVRKISLLFVFVLFTSFRDISKETSAKKLWLYFFFACSISWSLILSLTIAVVTAHANHNQAMNEWREREKTTPPTE